MEGISANRFGGGDIELSGSDLDELRARLQGRLLVEGDGDYDQARRLWNGMIDRYPALIVCCTVVEDVVAAVGFARDNELLLGVRGGGHNVAGRAVLDGAMVIDLSGMRGVEVDASRRRVYVEGGALLDDITVAAQRHGLAVPVGVVSETGIGGLTLYGGYGFLSRKYGMTVDNLVSVDIVTADGRLLHADKDNHPDLFWAVRGGGGAFGVVTTFEFEAHPVGPQIWLGAPTYPASQREVVLSEFADFVEGAPDEWSGLVSLWNGPDLAEVPAEIRGVPVITVVGCFAGTVEEGRAAMRPLQQLGSPMAELGGEMPFEVASRYFDDDYPDGHLYYWKSVYLDQIEAGVIDVLSAYHDSRPSEQSNIDIWAFGGAIARVAPEETAFPKRYAPFLVSIEANWTDPDQTDANMKWARGLFDDLQPFSSGGMYLNFPGFGEEEHTAEDVYAQNFERLQEIKAKYDGDNLFRGTFNIRPG